MKNNITLLYAENDQKLHTQYIKLFESMFCRVISAYDGEEAYLLYQKYRPKILVLDINMPKLDGLSLAKKIRQSDKISKIVILTAYSNRENLITAIPLLLVDFLVKPVKTSYFINILEKTVQEINLFDVKKINEVFSYDLDKNVLYDGTVPVKLTKNEIKMIHLFLEYKEDEIVENEVIFDRVWDDFNYSMTKLRSLVNRLNKKLSQKLIISYYGMGYKFIK